MSQLVDGLPLRQGSVAGGWGGGVEPNTEFKGGMWASGKLLGMENRKGNGDNKLQNDCKDNGI